MRKRLLRRRFLLPVAACLLLVVVAVGVWLFRDLPSPHDLAGSGNVPSIRITDRNGALLYDALDPDGGRHVVRQLDEIPMGLRQATIVTEDRNFYQNPGLELAGIVRALWINLRGGEVVAGGSTITQQVTRNLLLQDELSERTLRRKLREAWLAWRVSQIYSKDDILALYLNQMYYGAVAYGVEAAAQTYFGKPVGELTLAESALIAGLPQAPGAYNPFLNPEAAKARQEVVLGLMLRNGDISQDEHDLAARQPLHYAATPYPVEAAHLVMMVQQELDARFTPEMIQDSGGLTVRTTLDLAWQQRAERIIDEQLYRLNNPGDGTVSHNANNAALVSMDPVSGEIRALVGNADYFDAGNAGAVNMVLASRQPGSSIKPIVYAAAMSPEIGTAEGPWTAATMIPDVRTVFPTVEGMPYVPVNYSRDENGPVLLRTALASSLNIPAVAALNAVGLEPALQLAQRMGLNTLKSADQYGLSFALGGGEVRLLDLTTAFAVFANGGSRITPYFIDNIQDAQGNVLFQAEPVRPVRVLDERVAWLISDILSDNQARTSAFGHESILQIDRVAAVKTGTTNDFRDNWTVGYTPDLVTGVWVGNANNEPMRDVTGVSGAGPIWHHFMRSILSGQPDQAFVQPDGLVRAEICTLSGLLAGDTCPYQRREWFIAGTQPVVEDSFFRRVRLNPETSALLAADDPLGVDRLVLDLPPIFHDWARQEELPLLADLRQQQVNEAEAPAGGLRVTFPDQGAIYRLTGSLPPEAQQIPLQVAAGQTFQEIQLWVDGEPVTMLAGPGQQFWWMLRPGQHQVWAQGVTASGEQVMSEVVHFSVLDVGETSPAQVIQQSEP